MSAPTTPLAPDPATARHGALYAIAAYGTWGLAPLFWRQLGAVPADVVLAHRIVWGAAFFFALLALRGRIGDLRRHLRPRTLATFALSGALLSANWGVFVWAVVSDHVVQASLGYFINPLLNVVLGMAFLGERLRRGQCLALGLATIGVVQMTLVAGSLPWISLVLAGSFGCYGLVRKLAPVDALLGSNLETLLLLPAGLAWAWHTAAAPGRTWPVDPPTVALLFATGAFTAFPLLWFTHAARRLSLTVLGFLQYLAPTGQFLLAVFAFREPFSTGQLAAFIWIWIALLIFSIEARLAARWSQGPSAEAAEPW